MNKILIYFSPFRYKDSIPDYVEYFGDDKQACIDRFDFLSDEIDLGNGKIFDTDQYTGKKSFIGRAMLVVRVSDGEEMEEHVSPEYQ